MKTKTMSSLGRKNLSLFLAIFFVGVFLVGVGGVRNVAKGDDENAVWDQETQTVQQFCDQNPSACQDAPGETVDNNNVMPVSCDAHEHIEDNECVCDNGYGEDSDGNCSFLNLNEDACEIDADCVENVGSGYKCDKDSGNCVPDSFISGKECNDDADCTRIYGPEFTCKGIVQKTCEESTAPSAPTAAQRTAANRAQTTASEKAALQRAAAQRATTALANQRSACGAVPQTQETKDACAAASTELNAAREALDEATTAATAAVTAANGAAVANGASPTTGAGFQMCVNGTLALVCTGGTGTPFVAGASLGSSLSTGGLSYPTSGSVGVSSAKCGPGFGDIGGVCFPQNTGLSNASISSIAVSLFQWLMGLFTTLAVLAFVISGVQYFLASGNEELAETAKENAKNAIIGIVIGLSGFIIVQAIAAALSGSSIF